MDNLANVVGKNIASLRKARGLTQQELARQVNYSDKSISKWELGYAVPSVDILMDLASFFGVTMDYLVQEHTQESIEAVSDIAASKKGNLNKAIVIAMAMTVVVLIAMSIFFAAFFLGTTLPWATFIWMVPWAIFVAMTVIRILYGKTRGNIVLASSFVWTLLLSFCFHFAFFAEPAQNIWFILIIGIPIQVILILAPKLRSKN